MKLNIIITLLGLSSFSMSAPIFCGSSGAKYIVQVASNGKTATVKDEDGISNAGKLSCEEIENNYKKGAKFLSCVTKKPTGPDALYYRANFHYTNDLHRSEVRLVGRVMGRERVKITLDCIHAVH